MDVRMIGPELESTEQLDVVARPLARVAGAVPDAARDVLSGRWLGHPLHPMLTDLPIGFWTASWVLDLVGGRRSARVATAMVGLGVASAVPTVAAGLVDWADLSDEKKRPGVVHAAANVAATGLYALSLGARLRKQRLRGIALGMAGAAAATAGGYLGGHLVFGTRPPDPDGDAPVTGVVNGHRSMDAPTPV